MLSIGKTITNNQTLFHEKLELFQTLIEDFIYNVIDHVEKYLFTSGEI